MVIAKSQEAIDRIKILSLHGMSRDAWHRFSDSGYKHYQVVEPGFKYNMMDLQAAIGLHQLARVEEAWLRREAIWKRYQDAFADLPLGLPAEPDADTRHAYHLYTITVDEEACGIGRDDFMARLGEQDIGVGVHYQSLAQHPYYATRFGWSAAELPVADRFGKTTMSLPLSPKLSDVDVERVIAAVSRTATGAR